MLSLHHIISKYQRSLPALLSDLLLHTVVSQVHQCAHVNFLMVTASQRNNCWSEVFQALSLLLHLTEKEFQALSLEISVLFKMNVSDFINDVLLTSQF